MTPILPPRPFTPSEIPASVRPSPDTPMVDRALPAADVVAAVKLKNHLKDIAAKRQALAQLDSRMQALQMQLRHPGLPRQAVENAHHELQATEAAIRGLARALQA